jgi:predicted methyltransferase
MKLARITLSLAAAAIAGSSPALAGTPPPYVAAAVSSPDRPATDTARDALRHPAELVTFAGIKPGDQVADIMPGRGYFTRIFSKAVGPGGHVYAITPTELAQKAPKIPEAMKALAADPAFPNVTALVVPTAEIAAPQKLDVAWTSDNYHDVYGFFGADRAAQMDAAIFQALKPGGTFIVIDHAAIPGSGGADATKLHRIDAKTVEAQVEEAGFKLEAESTVLQNTSDNHATIVFAPSIRGKTDQFVFKFRKPR